MPSASSNGQGLVEYLLLLSLSVGIAGALLTVVNGAFSNGLMAFCTQFQTDLRAGRLSVDVWQ